VIENNEYWVLILHAGLVEVQVIKRNRWRDLPPDGEVLFVGSSYLSLEKWLKRSVEFVTGPNEVGMNTLTGVEL
jgi:hypothetical protein